MKNILITGGSSGIGYALVNQFLSNGYHVFAVSRNTTSLENLTDNHKNLLTIIKADITDIKNGILDQVPVNQLSIINNAAYSNVPKPLRNLELDELRQYFETNVFAPLMLIKNFLLHKHVDKILNISSGSAQIPSPNLLGYACSKTAIHHAIDCLKLEYLDTKFANLRPGMVDTNLQSVFRNADNQIFGGINPYVDMKNDHKLISASTVAEFVFWVYNHKDFDKTYWNIYEQKYQKHWLHNHSLFK